MRSIYTLFPPPPPTPRQAWFGEEKPGPDFYDILLPAIPKFTLSAELNNEPPEEGKTRFKYYRLPEIGA